MLNRYSQFDGESFTKPHVVDSIETIRHKTIKSVTNDIERFSFNTAIARLMEFRSAISKYQSGQNRDKNMNFELIKDFVLLLSPFAPHFSEEIWHELGNNKSIFDEKWPQYEEKKTISNEIEFVVQINGRIKAKLLIEKDSTKNDVEI
jgi:leucyl-tRNA synthetase